jgi:hypothetical protein
MSRFADDSEVTVVALGDCQCPGAPHAQDEATLHRQLGYGAKGEIQRAGWLSGRGVYFDNMAARRRLVEVAVVSWNLFGPDGKPVEPSEQSIARLDEETIDALAEAASDALEREPVPNDSGAPSAASSSESASPNRATRRRRASTTR